MVLSTWSEIEYFPRYCVYHLIASQSHSDMVHRQWYLPSNCNHSTVGNTLFLIRWTVPSDWQWNPDSSRIKHHVYIVFASHRTAEQSDWSFFIKVPTLFFSQLVPQRRSAAKLCGNFDQTPSIWLPSLLWLVHTWYRYFLIWLGPDSTDQSSGALCFIQY